jgi:ligand-binding sensor domain-containing protein
MRNIAKCLLLVLFPLVASAQALKPGEWRTYTSMRTVQQIALSHDSLTVWAATSGGAFRIDSRNSNAVTAYRTTDGLYENDITAVATDNAGNTYFGGRTGGFDILSPSGTIRQRVEIRQQSSIPVKTINRIYTSGDRVYLSTAFGLSIYSTASGGYFVTTIGHIADLPQNDSVLDVLENGNELYLAMNEGVAVASRSSELTIPSVWHIGHLAAHPTTLVKFGGKVLVGTDSGLFQFTGPDTLTRLDGFGNSFIVSTLARNDTLYVLTTSGLLLTSHDLSSVNARDLGKELAITSRTLSETKEGLAIIGTQNNGVILQTGHGFTSGIFPSGPVNNEVTDLTYSQRNDAVYSVHRQFGISSFNVTADSWVDYPAGQMIPAADFFRVLDDPIRDVQWVSGYGAGLFKMKGLGTGTVTSDLFDAARGMPAYTGTYVVSAGGMIDRDGRFCVTLWAASGQAIAATADGQNFTMYPLAPSSDHGLSWGCITQDHEGNYWVGTVHSVPLARGVYWSKPQNKAYGFVPAGPGTQIANTNVNAILTDQDDGIWCGTESGVNIISNPYAIEQSNPQFYVRSVKLLEQQVVHAMAVDGIGNKWIGTDNGIFVVSPDGTDSIAHFSTSNSPLVDDDVETLAIDQSRGEIYAGTPNGISRFSTIFTSGKPDYSGIRVYPNPLVQTSESSPTVTIDGLVSGSTVKVFTLNGRLVATINGEALGSTVKWDGRDSMGRAVASGMYLITATSPQSGDNGEAKLVIVRDKP